jgi:hypothetical protein
MNIARLKEIAEGIENSLLEKVTNKQIVDYMATIKPDGTEVTVYVVPVRPIKNIKVSLVVAANLKTHL